MSKRNRMSVPSSEKQMTLAQWRQANGQQPGELSPYSPQPKLAIFRANDIAPANCAICGRALTDPDSVERGIGPECSSKGYPTEGTPNHTEARALIRLAAIEADKGDVDAVRNHAKRIAELGYENASNAILKRWENAEKNAKIDIFDKGDVYNVITPFRRSVADEFIAAWRAIPGREYRNSVNIIPKTQKVALWKLLIQFFSNEYGKIHAADGSAKVFRIVAPDKQKTAS